MDLEDLKLGDLVLLTRHEQYPNLNSVCTGVFIGSWKDLTPTRMESYVRIYLLELGGKIFSLIYWFGKDKIEKIV